MNKTDKNIYISTKDFLISGESFNLLYDSEKKMLCTSPTPKELSKYYESDAYISHTDSNKGLVDYLYQQVKSYSLAKKVNLIEKLNQGTGSLADIGAGTGDFLKQAVANNWKVDGVEPNKIAVGHALKKGIDLKGSIDHLSNDQFDVVTLWHVLEHLPDLTSTIEKIENLVRPGGVLIIAVPNFNSYDANYYKEFWAAYDVPRHLWHFSRSSMTSLFSNQFKLETTRPMLFDSFYVSLLSEKNKNKTNGYLRAFFVGLWSNLRAIRSKEYSSVIYCFRKENKRV